MSRLICSQCWLPYGEDGTCGCEENMTTEPEALRLADRLQASADDPMWADHAEIRKVTANRAAAELRRLHAEVEALKREDAYMALKANNDLLRTEVEALRKDAVRWQHFCAAFEADDFDAAIDAIAKHLPDIDIAILPPTRAQLNAAIDAAMKEKP